MSDAPKALRPLHLQTIDSLFAELIGGASISVGDGNAEFRLDSGDSRAILNWYRLNRNKWAGNVMTSDVEASVSAMLTAPPSLRVPDIVTPKAGRRIRLVKVVGIASPVYTHMARWTRHRLTLFSSRANPLRYSTAGTEQAKLRFSIQSFGVSLEKCFDLSASLKVARRNSAAFSFAQSTAMTKPPAMH